MKVFKTAVLIFIAAAAFSAASAQMKVGYVNINKVFAQFEGTKTAQARFDKEVAVWEQEAVKRRKEIDDLRTRLEKQSLILNAERRKALLDSLQLMTIESEKFVQEKFGRGGAALTRNHELTLPIIEKMQRIINRIAREEQYDYIFEQGSGSVVFARPAYDLTDKVLAELAKER
ncbi:MAG: OmpH family outer membrane protein [Chitinispirillia bacterium]|nr:OmpH family outer membrane protein [Chitinispirillia bacterium]MCL2241177.1 OmpH family outer membrane protein [Chitinispirillia bacterium]